MWLEILENSLFKMDGAEITETFEREMTHIRGIFYSVCVYVVSPVLLFSPISGGIIKDSLLDTLSNIPLFNPHIKTMNIGVKEYLIARIDGKKMSQVGKNPDGISSKKECYHAILLPVGSQFP